MRIYHILAVGALSLLLNPYGSAATCPQATFEELSKALAGSGDTKIIFFASWCSSCKEHLEKPQAANTIFVAAFDEPLRAEKVLQSFNVSNRCFWSDDVARHFNVRSLPATRSHVF